MYNSYQDYGCVTHNVRSFADGQDSFADVLGSFAYKYGPFKDEFSLLLFCLHQETTRVILCRLILTDIIIHINFFNDIIMFYKIV